jgi:hypothetical protein
MDKAAVDKVADRLLRIQKILQGIAKKAKLNSGYARNLAKFKVDTQDLCRRHGMAQRLYTSVHAFGWDFEYELFRLEFSLDEYEGRRLGDSSMRLRTDVRFAARGQRGTVDVHISDDLDGWGDINDYPLQEDFTWAKFWERYRFSLDAKSVAQHMPIFTLAMYKLYRANKIGKMWRNDAVVRYKARRVTAAAHALNSRGLPRNVTRLIVRKM